MEPKIWTTYSEIVFILFPKCLLVPFCHCFVLKRGFSMYPRPTLNSQSSSSSSLLCADSWTMPHLGSVCFSQKKKKRPSGFYAPQKLQSLDMMNVWRSQLDIQQLELADRCVPTAQRLSSCTLIHELFNCVTCICCCSPCGENSLMKEAQRKGLPVQGPTPSW